MNDPRLSGMSHSSFLAKPSAVSAKHQDENAFALLIDRLRKHAVSTPPTQYRCIGCLDLGSFSVPHPKSVQFTVDLDTGEVLGGWKPPCQELLVTCTCPAGSAKYAAVNDWLREHKKDRFARIWSIRDYYAWLCEQFHEVFGTSEAMAKEWVEMQTPRAKALILAECRQV
ncbi:MAG: hypothetical protein K2X38_08785 [Gemmataceae bacterium]|nr:hypothetical protein [Gemmataceae bacterium]